VVLQGARHPLGSPGYLDVAGITTPELTANKRRDTLHQFSAHILIDPNGQDAISWVVRFSDNPLRFSRSHGRWSGYLFRIQGLSVHKPTVTFYSCGLFRRCEPLAGPVPLINQDVYHANELQVDIQGADSRFTLKGQLTGKDKDEGGEPSVALIDLSEVPFVDPDRRYLWGNVAFLNLNSNLEPVQGRGFKLTQIEIRLKPIVARHGATP
jgi:hypothetical protein